MMLVLQVKSLMRGPRFYVHLLYPVCGLLIQNLSCISFSSSLFAPSGLRSSLAPAPRTLSSGLLRPPGGGSSLSLQPLVQAAKFPPPVPYGGWARRVLTSRGAAAVISRAKVFWSVQATRDCWFYRPGWYGSCRSGSGQR